MLKKISISNFKGFRTELVFDLSSDNKYTFNEKCIKNNIVNNCMIYGYNGCGKSNLGLGIFDIIGHLTDKHKDQSKYQFYTNGFAPNEPASFCYEFLINGSTIQYSYKKLDYVNLLYEKLSINDREVVVFDRSHENTFFTSLLEGTETLNKEINDRKLSAIKFIRNNSSLTETTENKAFLDFYNFIDGMLFFSLT